MATNSCKVKAFDIIDYLSKQAGYVIQTKVSCGKVNVLFGYDEEAMCEIHVYDDYYIARKAIIDDEDIVIGYDDKKLDTSCDVKNWYNHLRW